MIKPASLQHMPSRYVWPALLVLGVASVAWAPSADGDIYWHLAAGREMFARGAVLYTDPFSVSAQGRPWIDVHWLFQVLSYAVHHRFGFVGLIALKCAALGGGAWLMLSAISRDRFAAWAKPLFVTVVIAALFAARALLLLRPVLVTLLCLALFFRELEAFRRDGRARHLYVCAAAQVFWANCQGLSALGPAVVAVYVLEAGLHAVERVRLRPLLLGLGATLLGSFATPFGFRGLSLSYKLLDRLVPGEHNVYAHTIAENVPPFLIELWSGGDFGHFKWFLALLAAALVLGGRRLRVSHVMLLLGFGGLAMAANRNVLLFYWIAAPITALHLAPAARRASRWCAGALGPRLVLGANAATLAVILCMSTVAAARETTVAEPSPFRAPAASTSRLSSLPGADVFSADNYGGYLIWQLYPRFRPYMDTRLVLRSAAEFADFLEVADFPERFAAFQENHHFGYVVLPVAYPDRYLGLIAELYHSPTWKLLYTNGSEVLFARADLVTSPGWELADPRVTDRITRDIGQQLGQRPELLRAARDHLARLELAVGEVAQAERALAGTDGVASDALRARCRFAAGDLDTAEAVATKLLARDRDDASSLNLLAKVALARGQALRSLAFVRRALHAAPFDAEASALLDALQRKTP